MCSTSPASPKPQEAHLLCQGSAMAAAHDDVVASVCGKKNTGGTGFRGVCRKEHGTYCARIWDPWRRAMAYLGSFRTAEEAARAYGAAAAARRHLKLQGAAGGITDFRQRTAATSDDGDAPLPRVSCVDKGATAGSFSGQDAGSAKKNKKKRAAPRPEARTEFRGVQRRLGGKYGAQIGHSKAHTWLGSFDTAEDAARAYDAAAVRLHGAAARTNFKADGGVGVHAVGLEKAARPRFRGVCQHRSGRYSARIWDSAKRARLWLGTFDKAEDAARAFDAAAVGLHGERAVTNFKQPLVDLNDFPELPALDFSDSIIPGAQLHDLWTDLPQAELQPLDELLQDMNFTDVAA